MTAAQCRRLGSLWLFPGMQCVVSVSNGCLILAMIWGPISHKESLTVLQGSLGKLVMIHRKVRIELPHWETSSRKEELGKWESILSSKMWLNKSKTEKQQSEEEESDRGESGGPRRRSSGWRSGPQHQLSMELKEKKNVL